MALTERQQRYLLHPINPARVLKAQGQSHLPAFDVIAYLNRFFGIENWDREIVSTWLIHETGEEKGGRTGWTVTYGCHIRLTIRDPEGLTVKVSDGVATGSANNLPSRGDAHDFALKNADSYALKRAAKDLGDGFGLSLYNKGSLLPVVRQSLAYDWDTIISPAQDATPTPLSLGNDERDEEAVSTDMRPGLAERVSAVLQEQ